MDKNLFIAVILTTLVILFFSSPLYQSRTGGKQTPSTVTEQKAAAPRDTSTSRPAPVPMDTTRSAGLAATVKSDSAAVPDSTVSSAVVQINPPAESNLVLENDLVKLTVSTRGGVITEAAMRKYPGPDVDSKAQLITPGQNWYDGAVNDGPVTLAFRDVVFTPETASKSRIKLVASFSGNRTITREYSLDPKGFIVKTNTTLGGGWSDPTINYAFHGPINRTEQPFNQIRIWPFSMFMQDETNMYDKVDYKGQGDRFITRDGKQDQKRIYSKEGIQSLQAKKLSSGQDAFNGDLDWYVVKNKYFLMAAVPNDIKRWKTDASYEFNANGHWFDFVLSKKVSDGGSAMDLYIGPMEYHTIKNYRQDLTQVMDLSWKILRPIAVVFLWIFQKLHMFIPNWGLVLIVFSVIIKYALWPLSKKSMDSMRKMSNLQPQINALREKHKNNPQALQKATMELYKQEGVNPFGGCLPILLQMPVFFALYPVVGRAFELRQAMFIPHWIQDLSRPDPFFILPIAMGISMYFQSKPTMKDPQQKPMLYIMPVMMVILFANFSAGLTLYWLMFNVLTWAHQALQKS